MVKTKTSVATLGRSVRKYRYTEIPQYFLILYLFLIVASNVNLHASSSLLCCILVSDH